MGAIIAGVISAMVGVIGSIATIVTNAKNNNLVKEQNEITRQREDDAVTRRAKDLENAGINPLLAGLGGASAQPGQLIPMQTPNAFQKTPDMFSAILKGYESQKEAEKDEMEKDEIKARTNLTISEIMKNDYIKEKTKVDIAETISRTKNIEADNLLKEMQKMYIQANTQKEKAQTAEAYELIKESKTRQYINQKQANLLMTQSLKVYQEIENLKKQGELTQKEINHYEEKLYKNPFSIIGKDLSQIFKDIKKTAREANEKKQKEFERRKIIEEKIEEKNRKLYNY